VNVEVYLRQRSNPVNDACQYAAATALDELLAVFVDDGYTRDDLNNMIDARLDDLYEEVAP
jgi:hypothetical protein